MKLARLLIGLSATFYAQAALAADFALKDGDRVVFYGDSITEQRLYTTFVETYAVTRFPDRTINFVHSGWGGDRVTGGGGGPVDVRLYRDVVAYRPTVVTIMLGMNDASYQPFKENIFTTYAQGYEHIVGSLKNWTPNARLTLIQPSPFDDVTRKPNFEGGYNAVLLRYADFVKDLANRHGATVADLNTGLTEATRKADGIDHETAIKFNPDRVHPAPPAQLLMAASLLKAWNAPSIVSEVRIHGKGSKPVETTRAEVDLKNPSDTISWTQTDSALPFPLDLNDPVFALALKSSDFVEALDRQILVVDELEKPKYRLLIDEQEVGTFSREDLASGINLAVRETPMLRQAARVHALTLKHNDVHFTRWRSIEVPLHGKVGGELRDAIGALDQLEAALVEQQREASRPRPHQFSLIPVD